MYYLVIVQNSDIPAIFSYETHDAALARFHTELAYRHESRVSTKCLILNSDLAILESGSYIKETITEPNTEVPQEG